MHVFVDSTRPIAGILLVCSILVNVTLGDETAISAPTVEFNRDIQPLLTRYCGKCHGPTKQQGSLRFDAREGALKEGDSGELAIVPGKPGASELLKRILSTDPDYRMPPEGDPLTGRHIDLITRWIAEGASWPEDAAGKTLRQGLVVTDEDRQHWSFLRLIDQPLPSLADKTWCHTDIDLFVLQELTESKLTPSEMAAPQVLIRRVYFDVIGLPPTPEQITKFLTAWNSAPNEVDRQNVWKLQVDELLGSVHYGERWGRHWLDLARYADSDGQESDDDRPHAWPYRDFVIHAFNQDLPFDTFVRWQLAGEEYEPDNPQALAATGFIAAGVHTNLSVPMEEEKLRNRYNELDDMLSSIGTGLLGLTLGCARCHDHKYDAIPTADYYRLLSALHSGDRAVVLLANRHDVTDYQHTMAVWQEHVRNVEQARDEWLIPVKARYVAQLREPKIRKLPASDEEQQALLSTEDSPARAALLKRFEKELRIADDDVRNSMTKQERDKWDELEEPVSLMKATEPASPPKTLAYRDFDAQIRPTWLFGRGDFYDRDEPVSLGFLSVLTASITPEEYRVRGSKGMGLTNTTFQRRALADWITDLDQGAGPLLARVFVNRVWQHHFGQGLVRTPSDFGVQGEAPTHPELLEWLAHDFASHGWSIKRLHRQILTSSAYLQSSQSRPDQELLDPENRLLWRQRQQRLEAEVLRDSLLAVSGELDPTPFGPAYKPPIPSEAIVARNVKDPYPVFDEESPDMLRRSIYMFHKRVVPYPLLQAFDRPDLLQSCGRRDTTTVAPQALALLNDQFVRARASAFASRLLTETPESAGWSGTVDRAFLLALGRPATKSELDAGVTFLRTPRSDLPQELQQHEVRQKAVTDFCQTLFCLNEFIYID